MALIPTITTAGLNAAIAANGSGLSLALTHMAIGAGFHTPTGAETALTDRREKVVLPAGVVTAGSPPRLTVTGEFPASIYGGASYNVGEIGVYAGDPDAGGTLFAYLSQASGTFASRGGLTIDSSFTLSLLLGAIPPGSITVSVDATAAAAHSLMNAHLAAANPHGQYLLKAGGTMTGPLVLAAIATQPLQPVALQQLTDVLSQQKRGTVVFGDIDNPTHFTGSVVFPAPFPTACNQVFLQPEEPTGYPALLTITSKSAAGFSFSVREADGVIQKLQIHWQAFGV